MTHFIEIKNTFNEQLLQIKFPNNQIINVEWDFENMGINIRTNDSTKDSTNDRLFWIYTPDLINVKGEVVPNITLLQLVYILGFENHPLSISAECDYSLWDELIYELPLCQVVIYPYKYYSQFETGFKPFLE